MSIGQIIQCPWTLFPEHNSSDGCHLIRVSDNEVKHVFKQTSYTMSSETGLPLYNDTDFMGCVKLSDYKFSANNPRCSVTTALSFDYTKFVHASEFKVQNNQEFWWFLDSIIKLWLNFKDRHGLYPREKSMMDFLVPKNLNSLTIIFLKPIHYTDSVTHYGSGVSTMIYNLYMNSYTNLMYDKMSKPPKLYCGAKCKFNNKKSKWWLPLRQLFGKNMYVHSTCCTEKKHWNMLWCDFVQELIKRRRNEYDSLCTKSSNKNQINHLHKKWLHSVDQINTI